MQLIKNVKLNTKSIVILLASIAIIGLVIALSAKNAWAKPALKPAEQTSPLHPTFPLLDEDGENVLDSGQPISTMKTCGDCHDTSFIAEHSYHVDMGLNDLTEPGSTNSGRDWDISSGWFGRWNPITYRTLSPTGDQLIDLGTAEWVQLLGMRQVGGGPAQFSREGIPLTELDVSPTDPETNVLDPVSGELVGWDWEKSGTAEMNCFLCHIPDPNSAARNEALAAGNFRWANTATLLGSEIILQTVNGYQWNPVAFDEEGKLAQEYVLIQDPSNDNCGLCHGLVNDNLEEPVTAFKCTPERWSSVTTGQIISPQRISDSGMNLANKEELSRPWDIHAERLLSCTDCHFALNNPVYYQEDDETRPQHLTFDPRRLEIGEYLYQPLHQFARGESTQNNVAPELNDTMRRCESCHSIEKTHNWLPYKERHTEAVSCESCHIPKMYSSAMQQIDWTVIDLEGNALKNCRGLEGESGSSKSLIQGFEPVLMPKEDVDGNVKIAPYNVVTSWFWVYGDPERPVRLIDLKAAFLDGDSYRSDILALFDSNQDGTLDTSELVIDSNEKNELISSQLKNLGLEKPHIVGEIQPYSINHTITHGEWATKDCQTCHADESRVTQPIKLSNYVPGNVLPVFVEDGNAVTSGELYTTDNGELFYQPNIDSEGMYLLGHNSVGWIDLAGSILFVFVLIGITLHAGLRFAASFRKQRKEPNLERVYMYSVYERLWHWLQTFTIVLLLFTGLIIHKPDTFGIFSFSYVVQVHNILAAILAINAALSLFYHVASGEIKQYIPRPRGFFDLAISQALYYMRGIFKGSPHPIEKTPQQKLNPLQQVTYIAILNVLLPLQGLTGIMMWGAQRWPDLAGSMGGLPFLAPFHTLIAWLFASFIVLHVYLTTTGHAPLAGIKSMMIGWDEIDTHSSAEEDIQNDDNFRDETDAQTNQEKTLPGKSVHQAGD